MTEPTPSSPSPSPEPAPSPAPEAPVAASPQTPPSPAGTPSPTASRPDYVPEKFWDATAGKVADDKAFAAYINEHVAFKAAEDSRKLTLPKAEDYKLELPADFQLPQGVEWKFDDQNPLWSQARGWANKHGLSQEAFAEGLALVAGDRIGTAAQVKAGREAEIAKLGATGPARVDAVETFFKAHLGEADGGRFMSRLFQADDVKMAEKIMAMFRTQGGGSFSGAHREADLGAKVSDEQWEKMTYSERKEYASRRSAA